MSGLEESQAPSETSSSLESSLKELLEKVYLFNTDFNIYGEVHKN